MSDLSAERRKAAGAHYTPKLLADFVAKQIMHSHSCQTQAKSIRILDPAVGDGELLLSLLEKLLAKGYSKLEVSGFDTSSDAIESAKTRIKTIFPEIPLKLTCTDFLELVLTNYAPNGQYSLFAPPAPELFDIVIANPPYVRTQVMGAARAQTIADQFGLSGRVDLYYAFITGIAHILCPGGIVGIIVSNRFLTTKSGGSVRKNIVERFDILHIWDLGDTRLFEAAVLPAVLLLKRKDGQSPPIESKFTSIYSVFDVAPEQCAENVITALERDGMVKVDDGNCYQVRQGKLKHGKSPTGVWHITTDASENWLAKVKANTSYTFGDIGKIRVGVKTTADKVFIRSDWRDMPEEERPELLRPLTTHHIARRFKPIEPKQQREILYPHRAIDGQRSVVNLDDFPRSAKYLNLYRSILEEREYVTKGGRKWYEIWVPHHPEAWKYPKIVFRDIAQQPTFWMDLSGSIVNGDCYWLINNNPEQIDLLWLVLAVANSSFIETFYDYRFHNKLYAGRRRFMTQYVEKFPLPNPDAKISKCIVEITKNLYNLLPSSQVDALERELDQLVWQAFGFSIKKIVR